jgi:uncharacterized protein YceK
MRRIVLCVLVAGALVLSGCSSAMESEQANTEPVPAESEALMANDEFAGDVAFMEATRQLYVDIQPLPDDIDSVASTEELVSVLKRYQNSARRWRADVSALEGTRYPHDFEKSRRALFEATKHLDDGFAKVLAATSSKESEALVREGLDEVFLGHDQMVQARDYYLSERASAKKKWGITETQQ